MNDMRAVIIPKSDQLNADDLLAGPMTITISAVSIRPGTEQPVAISFEGDHGKPYKPCKSMARVMVNCWGPDANVYTGRSLTLYRDPKVKWGGLAIGGIRISHMSHIDGTQTMALTETKGSRKPFTVKPLEAPNADPLRDRVERLIRSAEACQDAGKLAALHEKAKPLLQELSAADRQDLTERASAALLAASDRLAPTSPEIPEADFADGEYGQAAE